MATIVKNSAGNWKALIRKKGWPTTSKTFNTKRDAQDWARSIEDEMVRGVYINRAPSEKLTVKEALVRYLAEVSPTKARGTEKRARSISKSLIAELGEYSLAAISPKTVAEYRDKRSQSKNIHGRSVGNNQIRLELALLSHMFTIAMQEWGIGIGYNPVKSIKKPKTVKGRDRRLSLEEEVKLLAECDKASNPMLGWIVRLALESSMRKGEILNLHRYQVNLEKRQILLQREDTKTRTARIVSLSPEARRVLDQAINGHIKMPDSELVFWGDGVEEIGTRKPYRFNKAWQAALKRAGITGLTFHDLRHEAISRMVEGGLNDTAVATMSGHKSMQMLKHYTHLKPDYVADQLEAMSKANPWWPKWCLEKLSI